MVEKEKNYKTLIWYEKEIYEVTEYLSAQRQTLVGRACSQKEGEPKSCEVGPRSKAFSMGLSALLEQTQQQQQESKVGEPWKLKTIGYIRILQRNRREIGYIERYIRDLLWKWAHIITEAEKSHDTQSTSWRTNKVTPPTPGKPWDNCSLADSLTATSKRPWARTTQLSHS